jgi:hydrogenase-4 component B
MGGLIKRMPYTALFFLIGAMAISALPPLNGFASEWLTFQAFFMGALQSSGGTRVYIMLYTGILALTSGLAAACFVKAFGIAFLAMPRSDEARNAVEAPFSMRAGMFMLAGLAVVLGLGAGWAVRFLLPVAQYITGLNSVHPAFSAYNLIILPGGSGNAIMLSTAMIAAALFITIAALYWLKAGKKRTMAGTWDCGYYRLDSRNEYTSTAFSKPFRIAFSFFLLPYKRTEQIKESKYVVKSYKYETYTVPIFKKYFYEFMMYTGIRFARYLKRLQLGSIHLYIAYIFITLIALIVISGRFL